jgi:hypothetical protein
MSDAKPSGIGAAFPGNKSHRPSHAQTIFTEDGNLDRHDRQT